VSSNLIPSASSTLLGIVIQVAVPAIGDVKDLPVIEILVRPGDTVTTHAPLIKLEWT
jgi:pyruvate dehydrogenase E2 component (dihydrolipoamide acetyltransferase)